MRLALLLILFIGAALAFGRLRCFVGKFPPTEATFDRTRFYYDVDVLTPEPVDLQLPLLEFSAVLNDRCTWSGDSDSLELYMNRALVSFWPTRCSDKTPMMFGVGALATAHWGDQPLSPDDGSVLYHTQNGRIDFRTGTWSANQAPSRFRNITLRLYSGSERRFMPGEHDLAPLIVRVCLLAQDVPNDVVGSPYKEVEPPENTIFPLVSCVYKHGSGCGAELGYVSTAQANVAVMLRANTNLNTMYPADSMAGWPLPSIFLSGLLRPGSPPRLHIGWNCEFDDFRWHINGSMLQLDDQSRLCPGDPLGEPDVRAQFGINDAAVFAIPRIGNLPRAKVPLKVAQAAWAAVGETQPIIADRLREK